MCCIVIKSFCFRLVVYCLCPIYVSLPCAAVYMYFSNDTCAPDVKQPPTYTEAQMAGTGVSSQDFPIFGL